jgi:hypothetical protein
MSNQRDINLETLACIKELVNYSSKKYGSDQLSVLLSMTLFPENSPYSFKTLERWIDGVSVITGTAEQSFDYSFISINAQPDPAKLRVSYTLLPGQALDITNFDFEPE